jgi:hypothetical protein
VTYLSPTCILPRKGGGAISAMAGQGEGSEDPDTYLCESTTEAEMDPQLMVVREGK